MPKAWLIGEEIEYSALRTGHDWSQLVIFLQCLHAPWGSLWILKLINVLAKGVENCQ